MKISESAIRKIVREEILRETFERTVSVMTDAGVVEVIFELDVESEGDLGIVIFGDRFELSGVSSNDLITLSEAFQELAESLSYEMDIY